MWLPSAPSQAHAQLKKENMILDFENMILDFPEGAFVVTIAHEFSARSVNEIISGIKIVHGLAGLLAESEGSRFLSAVQDALTIYRYIVSLDPEPENIMLSGDSTAGNFDLSLHHYSEGFKFPELPPPGGVVIIST